MDPTALLLSTAPASLLEALMLVCFGIAWPVANLRMFLRRRSEGKGVAFTGIVFCGYAAGAGAKVVDVPIGAGFDAIEPVFWLYLVNLVSVGANLALQWHFGRVARRASTGEEPLEPIGALAGTQ